MLNQRQISIFATIYIVFIASWLAIGIFVVPKIIRDAYQGQPWPIISPTIEDQDVHSLQHYLNTWSRLHTVSIFILATVPLIPAVTKRWCSDFFDRFVGPTRKESLGIIRCWVFMILAINVFWEDLPSIAFLPAQLRVDMGFMSLLHALPGWDSIYTSQSALLAFKIITLTTLLLAMFGLQTRWTVPCATVLALVHGGILREYSHFYHTCLVSLHVAIGLCFMPCGDGFSLDRFRSGKGLPQSSQSDLARYGWGRYICWMIVAGAYVSAGLSKLGNGGLLWWQGENLKHIVLADTLNPMHFEWGLEHTLAAIPIFVFTGMGLSAVILESLYGLILFSQRARLVIPVITAGMHLGIWICQGILFFDLILIQAIVFGFPSRSTETSPLPPADDGPRNSALCGSRLQSLHENWFVACLLVFFVTCMSWLLRIENYPATAWQMYSGTHPSNVITYQKVFAVFSDGGKEEAHPERWIGAVADTRYRDILRKGKDAQKAFFEVLAKLANSNSSGRSIVGFEVVTYQWDFIAAADDPNFGSVRDVAFYQSDGL